MELTYWHLLRICKILSVANEGVGVPVPEEPRDALASVIKGILSDKAKQIPPYCGNHVERGMRWG